MKRRVISAMLAGIMMLTLAACGAQEEAPADNVVDDLWKQALDME